MQTSHTLRRKERSCRITDSEYTLECKNDSETTLVVTRRSGVQTVKGFRKVFEFRAVGL